VYASIAPLAADLAAVQASVQTTSITSFQSSTTAASPSIVTLKQATAQLIAQIQAEGGVVQRTMNGLPVFLPSNGQV
jgi:hypothetical protein